MVSLAKSSDLTMEFQPHSPSVISRNLKLGGYRQMIGGGSVNMHKAQIYIKKQKKQKKDT